MSIKHTQFKMVEITNNFVNLVIHKNQEIAHRN